MEEANRSVLISGLQALNLEPSPETIAGLLAHLDLVIEWNQRFNLTAIKDPREMIVKHLIDSASLVAILGDIPVGRVLDVGSGAGYPGVVVRCFLPHAHLVLLESLSKRCKFLEQVGETIMPLLETGLDGFEVIWGRAEDYGQRPEYRESFDLVTARAVAELRVLAEYCLPFCRVGGRFIAMKGPAADEEVSRAQRAIALLGGKVDKIVRTHLPDGAGERSMVVVQKVKRTPREYPRRPGTPSKIPL